MKIIEGMKELKRLHVKVEDLRVKISTYAADMDFETPAYPDQRGQITEWLQSVQDTLGRILELRLAIQRTNLATQVTLELGGQQVTKSIAEWIHRRRDLAKLQMAVWQALTPGTRRDGVMTTSSGEKKDVKVRLYFDQREKDLRVSTYRDEPSVIDGTLEVVNAVTELQLK